MKIREFIALLDAAADEDGVANIKGLGRRSENNELSAYGFCDTQWWKYKRHFDDGRLYYWDFSHMTWRSMPNEMLEQEAINDQAYKKYKG